MNKTPKDTRHDENALLKLAGDIISQARLAGLGAFAKIQQESGKLLESLIKEGEKFLMPDRESVVNKAAMTEAKSAQHFDDLEKLFEMRVSRALQRLEIPTREDLQKLQKQLQDLHELVESLYKKTKRKGQ